MKHLIPAVLAALFSFAAPLAAQNSPVVVELYTSQGCSSCPPADKILHELAARDDVIALALHVDYWDYIGWKDSFAKPAFTTRQRGYARAAGHRTIYTPQMIVGGVDHVVGYKPMELAALIDSHKDAPHPATIKMSRQGNRLSIKCPAFSEQALPMLVQLVRYSPAETVKIGRGENAGKTIKYHNIVTEWSQIGTWDGTTPLDLNIETSGSAPIVVVLQKPGQREIIAAARLR